MPEQCEEQTSHQSSVAVTGPQKAASQRSWVWLLLWAEGYMVGKGRGGTVTARVGGTDFM